jgi:uncharacterized protein YndB with AHSA1/START domain
MAVRPDEALECEVRIDARRETVFQYFVDAEKMALWMGRKAVLEPSPGGTYRVEISDQIVAAGEFVEVDAPAKVVFSFGWEGQEAGTGEHSVPPGSTRVEVSLEPDGDGTVVRLRHLDLPAQSVEIHRQGWELYLSRLAVAASGGDPGPDPNQATE